MAFRIDEEGHIHRSDQQNRNVWSGSTAGNSAQINRHEHFSEKKNSWKKVFVGIVASIAVVFIIVNSIIGNKSNGNVSTDSNKKEKFDWSQLETYHEKKIVEVTESEKNGSVKIATDVANFSRVTGKLGSTEDLDVFRFTVNTKSNMHFEFSHEGDRVYTYYWYATIYGADGKTVLNEGNIAHMDKGQVNTFSVSGLEPGNYYLRISPAKGGNPLMVGYSGADYHIAFIPECIEHRSKKQYITKRPTCIEGGEFVEVCEECDTVILTKEIESLGHNWSEWNVIKKGSMISLGEKERVCLVCGEKEDTKIWTNLLLGILLLLICLAVGGIIFKMENSLGKFFVLIVLVVIAILIIVHSIYSNGLDNNVPINTSSIPSKPTSASTCHIYIEVNRLEPTCYSEGSIDYICQVCNVAYTEILPMQNVHSYKIVSFTNNRNNNVCEFCGDQYYSYRTKTFNWICGVAIVVFLVSLGVIIISFYKWYC